MSKGIPYDVAFALPEADLIAYSITFGMIEGGEFDWRYMRFKEQADGS